MTMFANVLSAFSARRGGLKTPAFGQFFSKLWQQMSSSVPMPKVPSISLPEFGLSGKVSRFGWTTWSFCVAFVEFWPSVYNFLRTSDRYVNSMLGLSVFLLPAAVVRSYFEGLEMPFLYPAMQAVLLVVMVLSIYTNDQKLFVALLFTVTSSFFEPFWSVQVLRIYPEGFSIGIGAAAVPAMVVIWPYIRFRRDLAESNTAPVCEVAGEQKTAEVKPEQVNRSGVEAKPVIVEGVAELGKQATTGPVPMVKLLDLLTKILGFDPNDVANQEKLKDRRWGFLPYLMKSFPMDGKAADVFAQRFADADEEEIRKALQELKKAIGQDNGLGDAEMIGMVSRMFPASV